MTILAIGTPALEKLILIFKTVMSYSETAILLSISNPRKYF